MDKKTDEQLMVEFGKGDYCAFAVLYQRHKGSLFRYFVRQLDASQYANSLQYVKAEELFQEVWFRVTDKRTHYKPCAKFTTWLYQIARHLLIDEHRKRISELAYQTMLDEELSEENRGLDERNKIAIKQCVSLLAPLQREVFLLRYDSGFATAQICDITDARPEAVKSRLRYALEQLRHCLTRKLGYGDETSADPGVQP